MISRLALALLPLVVAVGMPVTAQEPAQPMACDIGPVKKTFGGTPWLVYGCSDGKSVVVITAEGSPAMPFYFLFSPHAGSYRLNGEGTGNKALTDAAFGELSKLGSDDINKLFLETKTKAG